MEITIIYEDDAVVVVDKPAGLAVHGDGRTEERTLVDWLLERYPDIRDVGEPPLEIQTKDFGLRTIPRPGIVHRLDRDTSGVLIIAKTKSAHAFLKEQFKNHTVEKKYFALVYGNFKEDEGVIDKPIGKSAKDFRQWSAAHGARGTLREARTAWRLLLRFQHINGEDFSLLEVSPQTGRTHQIRVHMKAASHPIVCDKLYGAGKTCPLFSLSRQGLHAHLLTLEIPGQGKKTFEAPMADDLQVTLEELRKLC